MTRNKEITARNGKFLNYNSTRDQLLILLNQIRENEQLKSEKIKEWRKLKSEWVKLAKDIAGYKEEFNKLMLKGYDLEKNYSVLYKSRGQELESSRVQD